MLPWGLVRTVNPNGGVGYRRLVEEQFSNDQLLERILSIKNVQLAWKQVRADKGAPGIDGVTVDDFPDTFRECWPEIRSAILEGNYTPSPVQRVEIPKPDGSTRPLGIPTVLDRVIQQSIARVLSDILILNFRNRVAASGPAGRPMRVSGRYKRSSNRATRWPLIWTCPSSLTRSITMS